MYTRNKHKINVIEENDINKDDFFIITNETIIKNFFPKSDENEKNDSETVNMKEAENIEDENTEESETENEYEDEYQNERENGIKYGNYGELLDKVQKYEFIFIFNDKIYTYRVNTNMYKRERYSIYIYDTKAAVEAFTKFVKELKISENFETIFFLKRERKVISMIGKQNILISKKTQNDENIYVNNSVEIIPWGFSTNTSSYVINNMLIIDGLKKKTIKDNISELYIVENPNNSYLPKVTNLFDDLPNTIEKLYIFFPIINSINNLPSNIKKIFTSIKYNIKFDKIPFGCEIVEVNI